MEALRGAGGPVVLCAVVELKRGLPGLSPDGEMRHIAAVGQRSKGSWVRLCQASRHRILIKVRSRPWLAFLDRKSHVGQHFSDLPKGPRRERASLRQHWTSPTRVAGLYVWPATRGEGGERGDRERPRTLPGDPGSLASFFPPRHQGALLQRTAMAPDLEAPLLDTPKFGLRMRTAKKRFGR